MNDPEIEEGTPAGGPAGQRGYEYQVDVSVWAAMELVMARRSTESLVLEPCSQEDLEAEVKDSDPPKTELSVTSGEKLLVIQVKSRTTAAWDVEDVKSLLKHGSETRASAKDRLKDERIHFLLVTNEAATGVARGLRTGRISAWPKPNDMPASIATEVGESARGRVAILDGHPVERIRSAVRELLIDACRVPQPKWEACYEELRTKHAIVIGGASGTGKTLTAEALWDFACRNLIGGLTRESVRYGPGAIRTTLPNAPVLFDIEDPWGRHRFMPDAEEWNDLLPDLLRTARPDRLFVVTTRSDLLAQADATHLVRKWYVPLETEHYRKEDRRAIFDGRMSEMSSDLQLIARRHRDLVLRALESPLEIQRFFDALGDVSAASSREHVSLAIESAHRESIHKTVAHQAARLKAEHWGVVVWGLLKAVPKLSRDLVPEIEQRLSAYDPLFETGFSQLLNVFVAGRNLRQAGVLVSYYHPQVERGLEAIVLANPSKSARILRYVADVLVSFDQQGNGSWGTEACANLAAATAKIPLPMKVLSATTQDCVDEWVSSAMVDLEYEFSDAVRLACDAGSTDCRPAEIARSFSHRIDHIWMGREWAPTVTLDDVEWFRHVAEDPRARAICERFVRFALPTASLGDFGEEIVPHVKKIAGARLDQAFCDAAMSMVKFGVHGCIEAVAAGALENLEAFEPVLQASLQYWAELEASQDWKVTLRAIRDGIYDDAYAEHLNDSGAEDGDCADTLLSAFVVKFRQLRGGVALSYHPRAAALTRWWLRVLLKEDVDPKPAPEEIELVAKYALNTNFESDLWCLVRLYWQPAFSDSLFERYTSSNLSSAVRQEAALTLLIVMSARLPDLVDSWLKANKVWRMVSFFDDLAEAGRQAPEVRAAMKKAIEQVPGAYQKFLLPFLDKRTERVWSLDADTKHIGAASSAEDEHQRLARVRFGLASGFDVESDIRWLLTHTQEDQTAVAAMEGAIQLRLTVDVRAGTNHTMGQVRACALRGLAQLGEELGGDLQRMCRDESKYVREAVVQLISSKPLPEHMPVLIQLSKDTWSPAPMFHNQEGIFAIARQAALAMRALESIQDMHLADLLTVAHECQDGEVGVELLGALILRGSREARRAIVEFAADISKGETRFSACASLLSHGELIEQDLIDSIPADLPATGTTQEAAYVTALLGLRGSKSTVLAAGAALADSKRRSFVLLLACGVQDSDLRAGLLDLLPPAHKARSMFSPHASKLPRSAISDLGDPNAVEQVIQLLDNYFEPLPSRKPILSRRNKTAAAAQPPAAIQH